MKSIPEAIREYFDAFFVLQSHDKIEVTTETGLLMKHLAAPLAQVREALEDTKNVLQMYGPHDRVREKIDKALRLLGTGSEQAISESFASRTKRELEIANVAREAGMRDGIEECITLAEVTESYWGSVRGLLEDLRALLAAPGPERSESGQEKEGK